MSTLKQLQEELGAKQKALSELFKSKPELDFTDDEVKDIQNREKELDDLAQKMESRRNLEAIAQRNQERLVKGAEMVSNVPFADTTKKVPNVQIEASAKSLGELFVESKAFKEYRTETKSSPIASLEYKDVFVTGATGFPIQNVRNGVLVDYRLRPLVMDSLVPMGRTNQQAIVYMEELAPTQGGAWVVENDTTKGEAAFKFQEKSESVRKVRISLPVSDEMMQDAPAIVDYVNQRLMFLLALKKDNALLNGTGTAPEIRGLLNFTGLQTQAKGGDAMPDSIFKAITNIQINAFSQPDAVIMHPTDYQTLRLLRTPDGIYVFGSPLDPNPARIWGLPLVSTQAIAQGTALVGDFSGSCQQFIRSDVNMLVSTENEDNFMRGLLTIKAEARLAMVVYRPAAFCTVTGL